MEGLVSKLKDILKNEGIDKLYTWGVSFEEKDPFSDAERAEILEDHPKIKITNFEKNIRLKTLLSNKLKQDNSKHKDLYFWIINSWGGIKGFKDTDDNFERINVFLKELENGKISRDSFNTLSSLSKIASFVDNQKYFIYDARVIYSLNWLLLSTKSNQEQKYFPMPTGRNSKLAQIDLKTVIYLINKDIPTKELYYSPQEAYHKYCELILKISKQISEEAFTEPYHIEMLLFAIADNTIFDDAEAKISIELKTS